MLCFIGSLCLTVVVGQGGGLNQIGGALGNGAKRNVSSGLTKAWSQTGSFGQEGVGAQRTAPTLVSELPGAL